MAVIRALSRRTRLAVEQLEDRLTPAITFISYSTGIFAYNSSSNNFRKITGAVAKAMHEGADGTLFASFASGTFRYYYSTNAWKKLTSAVTTVLSAASDNTMVASFNTGTFQYDTAWHKLTVAIANRVAVAYNNYLFASFSYGNGSTLGTYRYNSGWTKLSSEVANLMDASASGRLFVSFPGLVYDPGVHGYHTQTQGTYMYVGSTQSSVNFYASADIAVLNGTQIYYTIPSGVNKGTWEWHSAGYSLQVNPGAAGQMGVDSDALVASFGSGTWKIVSGHWQKISGQQAILIA